MGEVKSIVLFQDGDNLCASVNTVLNVSFPHKGVGGICVLYENVKFLKSLL